MKNIKETIKESYTKSSVSYCTDTIMGNFTPGISLIDGVAGVIIGKSFNADERSAKQVEDFVYKCGLKIGYSLNDALEEDVIGEDSQCVYFVPIDDPDVAYCYEYSNQGVMQVDQIK